VNKHNTVKVLQFTVGSTDSNTNTDYNLAATYNILCRYNFRLTNHFSASDKQCNYCGGAKSICHNSTDITGAKGENGHYTSCNISYSTTAVTVYLLAISAPSIHYNQWRTGGLGVQNPPEIPKF
jgi:hypothetical protein